MYAGVTTGFFPASLPKQRPISHPERHHWRLGPSAIVLDAVWSTDTFSSLTTTALNMIVGRVHSMHSVGSKVWPSITELLGVVPLLGRLIWVRWMQPIPWAGFSALIKELYPCVAVLNYFFLSSFAYWAREDAESEDVRLDQKVTPSNAWDRQNDCNLLHKALLTVT